jgi:hypothetical protein
LAGNTVVAGMHEMTEQEKRSRIKEEGRANRVPSSLS